MKIKIFAMSVALVVFILTEVSWGSSFIEFKRSYNSILIEPLSYVALSIFLSFFILLFFSNEVFNKWLKRFIYWYGPLAIILILTGSTGSSYTWFSRADLAIFFGSTLVAVTLVFALVQKLIYKK